MIVNALKQHLKTAETAKNFSRVSRKWVDSKRICFAAGVLKVLEYRSIFSSPLTIGVRKPSVAYGVL